MEHTILIVHAVIAIVVVALILIQQGKGAEAGAAFGSGSSQTVFGVQGGGNLLTRWTGILVALFFITSLSLAYFAKVKSRSMDSILDGIPAMEEHQEFYDENIPQTPVSKQQSSDNSEIPTE